MPRSVLLARLLSVPACPKSFHAFALAVIRILRRWPRSGPVDLA